MHVKCMDPMECTKSKVARKAMLGELESIHRPKIGEAGNLKTNELLITLLFSSILPNTKSTMITSLLISNIRVSSLITLNFMEEFR